MSASAYVPPDQAYRRSARLPISDGRAGAHHEAMTTYTTPQFATGHSDLRSEPSRTRPASAASYRTAGVSNEAAAMQAGQTPDWQPGASKGVPKAAIGAMGAALVGGVALAIVLMAPSNKVVKHVQPDPIAQAQADNAAAAKSVAATDAAVDQLDKNAPAAGEAASQAVLAAPEASAAAVPAPVQNVIPDAPPVAKAPVARVPKHTAAPRSTPQHDTPAATTDTPAVTPPADVQPPAMQQTPAAPTVTPSVPTPAPTPDTPAPTPAPTPSE